METFLVVIPILLPFAGAVLSALSFARPNLQKAIAGISLLLSLSSGIYSLISIVRINRPLFYQMGGWAAPFGIVFVGDLLSLCLVVLVQIVLLTGLIYSLGCKDTCLSFPTFMPIYMAMSAALSGTFLAGDLFNFFVFAELLVISATILTAISDDNRGVESALKYYLISTIASICMLIAIGTFYSLYGTLNLAQISLSIQSGGNQPLLSLGIILLVAAFLIKGAVFPFHFWQPDFHAVSPTPVSAMLSSVVVKVGVYGIIRVTTLIIPHQKMWLQSGLIILGVMSVLYAGFSAIGAQNVKRMLAYSTIGQIGFIVIAIGWGTPLSLCAALVFTVNHAFAKAAMLMLSGLVGSRLKPKSTDYEAIQGTGKELRLAGLLFMLGGISLAGLPPLNGFWGKYLVLRATIESGEYFVVALLAFGSILSLIYLFRGFQTIWWKSPLSEPYLKKDKDSWIAPFILIVLCFILGVWIEPLVSFGNLIAQSLLDPMHYISIFPFVH